MQKLVCSSAQWSIGVTQRQSHKYLICCKEICSHNLSGLEDLIMTFWLVSQTLPSKLGIFDTPENERSNCDRPAPGVLSACESAYGAHHFISWLE